MSVNSLSYFINGIKNQSEEIALKVAQQLHHFAGTELKEMPVDESNNFLELFNQRIFELVSSSDYFDKRAGILAIMSLIGIDSNNSSRLSRCANYLRNMLPSSNQYLMELAAKAIGYLALSSETYTAEYVDFETRRAFEWLCGERNEERRHAAVLVLKELALCTPTFFVQHLPQYFETIFIALKDTKPIIREGASLSLRAVLHIVSQRENRDIHKPPWYQISLNQGFAFLQEASSKERSYLKEEKTHGGLLTLNELLRIGCIQSEIVRKEFEENVSNYKFTENVFYKSPVKSRVKLDISINFLQFQNQMFLDFIQSIASQNSSDPQDMIQSESCGTLLIQNFDLLNSHINKSLSNRNTQVQLLLMEMIPRLAFLRPEKFNKSILHNCLTFLIASSRKDPYKSPAFYSMGYMVLAIKSEAPKMFPKVYDCVRLALSSVKDTPAKKKGVNMDGAVFSCIKMLIKSLKDTVETPIKDIIGDIQSCNLSPSLVTCLADICVYIPTLKPMVQENLLNYITSIIMCKPYFYYSNTVSRPSSAYSIPSLISNEIPVMIGAMELERLALAIRTLRNFDFEGHPLLELIKYIADHNLNMESKEIRIESIKTCFKLLYKSTQAENFNPLAFDKSRNDILSDILDKLIPIGVNDKKASVRLAVFESIDDCYDVYLVQPKHLTVFFMAFHDENFEIRENVLCILGRLSTVDPSTVLPILRKFLIQLLSNINDSGIGRNKEHSARLLALMIANVPRLVYLYVPTILKVINPVLKDPGPYAGVTINSLAAIGELALVCGAQTKQWNYELFAIVMDMLKENNLPSIREVALWTLGQLVESGGYVMQPYTDFPFLLEIFLNYLRYEQVYRIRFETIRVMGIIGAIDPFIYKNNIEARQFTKAKTGMTRDIKIYPEDISDIDNLPEDLSVNEIWVSVSASLEDFYPCAAISCLMKIIKDPSLNQHHTISVQAITFIFKSLGPKSHLYINKVVPTYLALIKSSDSTREFMFQQLAIIVTLVKYHMRNYLKEICEGIKNYWEQSVSLQAILISLLHQLALNIGADLRPYISDLLPNFLKVLNYDNSAGRTNTQKLLSTFQILGNFFENYIHIILPPIIQITTSSEIPLNVRKTAVETINSFLKCIDMTEFCCTIIHPILSLIDNTNSVSLTNPSTGSNYNGTTLSLSSTNPIPSLPSFSLQNLPQSFQQTIGTATPASGGTQQTVGSTVMTFENYNRPGFNSELRMEALKVLTCLLAQNGKQFITLFSPCVAQVMVKNSISYPPYETLIIKISNDLVNTFDERKDTLSRYDKLPTNIDDTSTKTRMDVVPIKKLNINAGNLQRAWIVKGRISKDDWVEWLKKLSIDILKESPSPSLRSCWALAQNYAPLAKDLFNASFVSCWMDLSEHYQDDLIDNLQEALLNSDVSEVVLTVLNLAEFMDHCEKGPLPLDTILLGQQALRYRAYAKALRYKEEEFYKGATPEILESLICINNKLKATEASAGILCYALKYFPEELKSHEGWYEKLNEWDAALQIYSAKMKTEPSNENVKMGAAMCLEALGEWSQVLDLVEDYWPTENDNQLKLASLACSAAWGMGDMKNMEKYISFLPDKIQDGAFYRAILNITKNDFTNAGIYISKCRDLLEPELSAFASESYERAYNSVFMAQILSEMEESMQYKLLPDRRGVIKNMWWDRLMGSQKILTSWHKSIQVHSLVITPSEDQKAWLKYVSLCNKNGRFSLAQKTLVKLLGFEPAKQSDRALMLASPPLVFSYVKYIWKIGNKNDAYIKLSTFVSDHLQPKYLEMLKTPETTKKNDFRILLSKCYLKMGQWSENLNGITEASIPQILNYYVSAIDNSNNWYKAWHAWACINFEALLYYKQKGVLPPEDSLLTNTEHAKRTGKEALTSSSSTSPVNSSSECEEEAETIPDTSEMLESTSKFSISSLEASKLDLKLEEKIPIIRKEISRTPIDESTASQTSTQSKQMKLIPEESLSLSFPSNIQANMLGLLHYIILAVKGFIQSISFSYSSTSLQDTLRLLTLCFDYGHYQEVYDALQDGIRMIRIDNWLQVIPQLIARIDTPRFLVHKLIHQLLIEIGNHHPQALIYPLTVASKSDIPSRQISAKKILRALCENNNTLVQQALMVSEELIRVSILWHELWYEGLEDASRLYFGEKNVKGMLSVLEPLHTMIEKGPQTIKETSFSQAYGRDLLEAKAWCHKYLQSGNVKDLTQAWDLYYHVFRRISKELPQISNLQLQHVSPKLMACKDLELAVPGTYKISQPLSMTHKKYSKHQSNNQSIDISRPSPFVFDSPINITTSLVRICKIQPSLQVISSKQRPRKLRILGDDGVEYLFLLKGHEDLRQDERVMQLFGLINTLLKNDEETVRRNLVIQRYAVVPLSTNSGLISWVPHCDTLHTCVKEYRESRKILLNIEHKMMLRAAPDYEKLGILHKTEVLEHALQHTKGDDLGRILWLRSPPNSQDWFERRTNFTRSLALMSVVGYILGLGDRHPSNLMLDRITGKILHIDFGDCFEVAMSREKFPEKVPFRLTRMLINAMEVSGIEGTFRMTCERVMEVLQMNKDSVMSVLEAFVYDPLINWRLIESEDQPESLNLKALAVIKRVKEKLTGKDFDSNIMYDIKTQIDLLIKQATSHENLCQMYIGWCPFW
ncbi:unnamed protein product [Gordionus sp. m RMFG-2023]|uniref:serine/threonine-protein kinase mTOR-like n=1 Tax=Gordionus sp. m RMFG-2023 TaxID=3053472 RepID=UPI0030E21C31